MRGIGMSGRRRARGMVAASRSASRRISGMSAAPAVTSAGTVTRASRSFAGGSSARTSICSSAERAAGQRGALDAQVVE